MYYQIYVKNRKSTYTYSSDKELEIGSFCEVDFTNKKMIGIVIRESRETDIGEFKIKAIERVLDIPKISEKLLKLAQFINSYYITDFFASLSLLGPYENMDINRMNELGDIGYNIENNNILNEEQKEVFDSIVNSDDKFFLLHGITGSGKTQVYISLIEKALKEDKSSIFLVPEISLTTQMLQSIKKVFGDNISIIHSKMTSSKKAKEWGKIYSGKCKVIIGARSAIFAPVKNLGYIIIDEEHESTYKQEDNARYHTRNVAFKRAMLEDAKVILGSATPSFESYYLAKENKIKLLKLNKRYNNASLPDIDVINLENEESILSKELLNSIKDVLKKGEQVILILNRKAHSLLVRCNDCKEKISCPRCSINLKYYKSSNLLKCSHCEYKRKFDFNCPTCNSSNLELLGVGIENIEEELNDLFGSENILRMDSTTMKSNKSIEKAYKDFKDNKYSILIGTQIAAKGFHFPNVTLVGIINADQMLSLPDFRSGEKTFQLIVQAAGRAGREDKKGRVIIQTYDSENVLIKSIVNNDYLEYFNYDMSLRKILKLAPYRKMINIIVSSKDEKKSLKKANEIYYLLRNKFSIVENVSMAGIYKIEDRYRYIIKIKTDNEEISKNRKLLLNIKGMSTASIRVLVDVDPIAMS